MWTCSQVLEALGLTSGVEEKTLIDGFSFHTPTLKEGQAFIALRGAVHDGHHYLGEAWSKGASLLIAEKESASHVPEKSSHVLVPSTYEALNRLGSWARRQAQSTRVVAVTGSVGKTTTKSWIHQLLSSKGATVASQASYNNHTGVPLSLTDLIGKPDFGVFEVGMNHAGEIAPLAKMIQPDACIITAIGAAHIGHMGSLEAIADEKATVQQGLEKGGMAILPFDSPHFNRLKQRDIHTISFGTKEGADVRLLSYREQEGISYIEVDVLGKKASYILPFVGQHYAHNVLSILALADHWGLKDLPIHNLKLSSQRGEVYSLKLPSGANICVMDDSYNANPTSMRAGLNVFGSLTGKGRRIAIIGAMFELGEFAEQEHRNLVAPLRDARVDHLYAIGPQCLPLVEEWNNPDTCAYADKATEIVEQLTNNLQDGDVLFLKGSNSSGVRHIMTWLRHNEAA